jgi:hypothetical protein
MAKALFDPLEFRVPGKHDLFKVVFSSFSYLGYGTLRASLPDFPLPDFLLELK